MAIVRFVPLILAIILVGGVAAYSAYTVPATSTQQNVIIKVGYEDSLDETTVQELWGDQNYLAPQGIHVIPTYYDNPALACKAFLAGQIDIGRCPISAGLTAIAQGVKMTYVSDDSISSFTEIACCNITNPSQMIGLTVQDSGPGSLTRADNIWWYGSAGIPLSQTGTYNASAVNTLTAFGNVAKVQNLETNRTQAEAGDTFLIPTLGDPAVNNSAHNGPFHVLFTSPNLMVGELSVMDSWIANPTNQQILVKYIEGSLMGARYFDSNPAGAVQFMTQQLPETPASQIQFSEQYYPVNMVYLPWGRYNYQDGMNLASSFAVVNTYLMDIGTITSPVSNSSVQPYGVFNARWEAQALGALGPFHFPCSAFAGDPYFPANFTADLQAWVPSQYGGPDSSCTPPGH